MSEDKIFLIDIDKVLRDKMPKSYQRVPRFLINYLKKIAHQDDLNRFLTNKGKGQYGVGFLEATLDELDWHVQIEGKENLPTDRLCTFVSNHPLGGADGVTLGYVLGKHYDGRVKYLVNDLLMNLAGLAPLCIPINKTGKQSRDFPRMVEAGFKSDDHLIMFPAGLCSRKIHGKIQDVDWKKTFITKSVEAKRDVVPVYFEGRNSNFFYNLANFCKWIGLKTNIAMLYLVDEMYKNQHKTFTITFGKPIPWQTFDKSKNATEWAQWVKDVVYRMAPNNQKK